MALALCTSLGAQDARVLTGKDLLNMFNEYNPSVLQRAIDNKHYQSLLNQLTTSYTAPYTDENEVEMIAVAVNFDNSIRLEALRQSYIENRTLQTVMGADLASLEKVTQESLLPIVQDIFKNTLKIKKIQIERYKQQLKSIKKDKTLSAEEKQQQETALKNKIRQAKQELASLKQNSQQRIADAAEVHLARMRSDYEASLKQDVQAEQSSAQDVKADHKKPVAQ